MVREGDGKGMDGKGKGDGKGMVKGMSSIHVGVMSSLGYVASSPSLRVLSSPLRCRRMLYRGCVMVPCCCCPRMLSSHVLVMSSLS